MNRGDINKITNNYILKSLFAYLKYDKILKLVNINKGLQNRLDINLDNYKEIFNFPKYEYTKYERTFEKTNIAGGSQEWGFFFLIFLIVLCVTCIFFIYSLIYSILLVTMDLFDDNNSEENFEKSSVNIIKKINACTFILDIVILPTPFLLLFIFNKYENDYGLKKYIKAFILIIINLTHFSFEGLIIWKLVLSYKIIKGSITWFMVMDYIFIFLNFFYIIYLVFSSYIYFADCGINIKTITEIDLISFNDIKINDFSLPENFLSRNLKERKKYVLNNYSNYTYKLTSNQYYLINTINNFRQKKRINKLRVNNKIPNYLIDRPTELMINSGQNFFKLSDTEFLFKFQEGNFEENFEKKNENIINILSKDNLNQINIISKGEYEYIFIYGNFNSFYNYYDDEKYSNEMYGKEDYQRLKNYDYNIPINSSYKKYSE